MVLIDTSAWIDFFKDNSNISNQVAQIIDNNQCCYCGPILTEILRGCHIAKQREALFKIFNDLEQLEDPENLWKEAGLIGATLKKKGYNLKTFDLLIATYALSYDVYLLTKDNDFKLMKKAGLGLRLL